MLSFASSASAATFGLQEDAPLIHSASLVSASDAEVGYETMTREQLLRKRARLVEDRPGAGGMVGAWFGILLGGPGGIASAVFTAFFIGSPYNGSLGAILLIPTVVGLGLLALGIYWLIAKSPERRRIGAEIDIVDDLLESRSRAAVQPDAMMRVARF